MNLEHLEVVLDMFHKELNRGRNNWIDYSYPIPDESRSDCNKDVIIWYHINKDDYYISTSIETIYKP
jgi:hypothetical protein